MLLSVTRSVIATESRLRSDHGEDARPGPPRLDGQNRTAYANIANHEDLKVACAIDTPSSHVETCPDATFKRGFERLRIGTLAPRGAWGHVDDMTIRYNYISHVGTGFQLVAALSCHPESY